ncbi:MAG: TonB-dependent receptor, partial [Candidatus Aureabacteria bacterium]|nr:TonB-dependent receptor [Candidatus Auribacterota bacterium]
SELKLFHFRTLGEALRSATGFVAGNDPAFDQFIIRGIGIPYDYNTRVLILINGHPLNEWIGNSALDVGEKFLIPLEAVKQIEITRGPGSVIYGTSAFLGVINVQTKDDYNGFTADIQYGSFNEKEYGLTFGKQFSRETRILFSASHHETDGDTLFFDQYEEDPTEGYFDLAQAKSSHYFLNMKWKEFSLTGAWGDFYNVLGGGLASSVFYSDKNVQKEVRSYLELKYEMMHTEQQHLTLKTFYDHYDYRDEFDYRPDPFWYDVLVSNSYGGECLLNYTGWEKNAITTGVEIIHAETKMKNGEISFPHYVLIEKDFNLFRYFLKDEFSFNERLLIITGAQYNHHELFDQGWVLRGAFIFKQSDATTFKGVYSQGFRSPTIYEALYEDDQTYHSNPDLKREDVDTIELVMEKKIFNNQGEFSASLYHNRFENMISDASWEDPLLGLIETNINSGSFSTQGAELTFKWRFLSGQELVVNGAWQDDCGNDLINFPQWLANLNVAVPFGSQWTFSAIINYVGQRYTRDLDTELDPYTNVDAGILSKTLFNHLDLWIGVKNIFDEEIQTALGGGFFSLKGPFRGRSYCMKLSARF